MSPPCSPYQGSTLCSIETYAAPTLLPRFHTPIPPYANPGSTRAESCQLACKNIYRQTDIPLCYCYYYSQLTE